MRQDGVYLGFLTVYGNVIEYDEKHFELQRELVKSRLRLSFYILKYSKERKLLKKALPLKLHQKNAAI